MQVLGKGVLGSVGIVMSINEQEGIATVKFPSCEYRRACKASDVLTVPISRLCTPRSEVSYPVTEQSLLILALQKLQLNFHLLSPISDRLSPSISSRLQKRWYKQSSRCCCHKRAVSLYTPLSQLQETAPAQ